MHDEDFLLLAHIPTQVNQKVGRTNLMNNIKLISRKTEE